jgi:hypothetical protein
MNQAHAFRLLVITSGHGFTGHPSESLVDVRATASQFAVKAAQPLIQGGEAGARRELLHELRQHVEVTCSGSSRGQIEEQVKLLANAVFVNAYGPESFRAYEAYEAWR